MAQSLVERVGTHVDVDRLRRDVERTGTFGAVDGEGHARTALTADDANAAAREYLVDRLEAADCSVRVDAVGNVVGQWVPPGADPDAAAVASGSHLDSVVQGGIFDGPLGVYAALEGVRAMQDAVDGGVSFERPLDVVSFTEEEGHRFSDGLLGSSVAVGHTSVAEALALTDADGVSLEDALEDTGFRGEGRLDAAEWNDWLELHVEQGRTLEQAGVPVGIVTSIAGTARCRVDIEGEANHAGTTAMGERADALVAAADVVRAVERVATDVAGPNGRAVGTVGCLDVDPGAVNVVPGRTMLELDLRDPDADGVERLVDGVEAALERIESERPVTATIERTYDAPPIPMHDGCRSALANAADVLDVEAMPVHSGAGHDTMRVGICTDVGMLFVPSRNGVSHSPREWTDWADCAHGTRVLAGGLATLAGGIKK
jgi:N-carbamoyl-L-amino-acid hydrolase